MLRLTVIMVLLALVVVLTLVAVVTRHEPVPIVNRPVPQPPPKQVSAPTPPTPSPTATALPAATAPPPAPAPQPPPLAYKPDGALDAKPPFQKKLGGLAVDPKRGILYAAGDNEVRTFDLKDGKLLKRYDVRRPALCVACDADGNFYVGESGRAEFFGVDGARKARIADGKVGEVTAIAVAGKELLLGDANAKRIRRFEASGQFKPLGEIPSAGLDLVPTTQAVEGLPAARRPPQPSLVLPNKVLDFAVDPAGLIVAAHPGRHRVETYDAAGRRVKQWGQYDERDPKAFCGCCNPINVTAFPLAALGRGGLSGTAIVTAEKSIARVKVYDAGGNLLAVIGPENFDQSNTSMAVAVDGQGRIYVADTTPRVIRRFVPAK